MLHWLRRGFVLCLLGTVWISAGCGDDPKKTPDGTAGTTGFVGVTCGTAVCKANETCSGQGAAAVCVAMGCLADTECGTGKCCNQMCFMTLTDSLNCGACGTACTASQSCVNGACTGLVCPATTPIVPTDDDAGTAAPAPTPTPVGANGCPANEACSMGTSTTPSCMCGTASSCPSGQSCSAAGACSCGASGATCTTGQACCGGACVDVQANTSNCGACGNACATGQACTAGVCGWATAGQTACDGSCVSLQTSAAHCGACDTACATGATCTAGKCACPAGQIDCKGKCVDASDDAHCGACNEKCTKDLTTCGEREADSGEFECLCPNFHYIECGGACVDPRTPSNCGECGEVCPAPATICKADPADTWKRSCECSTAGEAYCQGVNDCVNLTTDEGNCGKCGLACAGSDQCVDGECKCTDTTKLFCEDGSSGNYACIPGNTEDNCFACGATCLGNTVCDGTAKGCVCVNGSNQPIAGKGYCDGKCIDILLDEANCGGCDIACPSGSTCTAGECSCPQGQDWCDVGDGLECAPVTADVNNCGSCGAKCGGSNNACCAGTCKNSATYQEDDNNCGTCGTKCATMGCGFLGLAAKHCNAGVCNCN